MKNKWLALGGAVLMLGLIGYGLSHPSEESHAHGESGHAAHGAAEEFERGPHQGRMLREDDFALEVTIFEDNVPPEFRIYAYKDDEPVDPTKVQLTVTLSRLDGEVNIIRFVPVEDFLKGDSTVVEPHSFDVKVKAAYDGDAHDWGYASYEGRTTISTDAAEAAGIATEAAGPAVIKEAIPVTGRIMLNRNQSVEINARFPGIVREVFVEQGQTIAKGDPLIRIESNDSLQSYTITAPISGVVLDRDANVGTLADAQPLFHLADLSEVWAEFHVFSRHAARVKPGLTVRVKGTESEAASGGRVSTVLPVADLATQTVLARVPLANPENLWRPGTNVTGEILVSEREVPLTVRTDGLQRFRDFTVVFAQVGETYEVRMLELGASDGERTEVRSGIKSGQAYVSQNSFLIKADIEKSGTSHDH